MPDSRFTEEGLRLSPPCHVSDMCIYLHLYGSFSKEDAISACSQGQLTHCRKMGDPVYYNESDAG